MDVVTALRTRRSVRAFKPDPVDDALLHRVLDAAREAPSWSNTQPYLLGVANGARCEALRKDMLAAVDSRAPEPDFSLLVDYPPPLKERRQATGYGLYAQLGIERSDMEGRARQFRRNYAFFDAPAVMFLFVHEALGPWAVLDGGVFLQSIMLAATELGLQTCAQAALASYPDVVRKHFTVPERYKLMCGLAIGYGTADAVNSFKPERLPVEALLLPARE